MNDREAILLDIIHLMADKFKDQMILKGGMLLRLLNSYRQTRDIDYVFISKESKKILVERIKKALQELDYLKIEDARLNSRGIFIDLVSQNNEKTEVFLEISVLPSLHMKPERISTVALSNQYSRTGRIVSTMSLSEAFAHKIAAALERDTMRDLYDISIYEPLCSFDKDTLEDRLNKLCINREKPKKASFSEAAEMLRTKAESLNEDAIEKELGPLMPTKQIKGISLILKSAILKTAEKMKNQ